MNVFMVTKPISPYWDEGSKNLAFSIANHIKTHTFHLMTCKNVKLPQADNIIYHNFYSDTALNVPQVSLLGKIKIFLKIFSQKDIDVYHFVFTPRFFSSLVSRLFFKFSGKKSVQTISTPLTNSQLKSRLFADKIVVLSDWTKARVLELGYENVVKISPGIDLEKFSKNKISSIRERLGISENEFIVLFPCEYDTQRGTRTVLRIIKRLLNDFPKVRIIFAGRIRGRKDIKEKKFLVNIINHTGFKDRVIFLERIDFMPELINSSDIVIFPILAHSVKMEIPMVLLESLALEKPIIISDMPPLNEIFSGNKAGIKIKPGDDESLLSGIIELIKYNKLKKKLGKEGRLLVEKKYNIQNTAKEYERLYKELCYHYGVIPNVKRGYKDDN